MKFVKLGRCGRTVLIPLKDIDIKSQNGKAAGRHVEHSSVPPLKMKKSSKGIPTLAQQLEPLLE